MANEKEISSAAEDNSEALSTGEKQEKTLLDKVLTVVGIVLCVILAPILIANVTMIVKSWINPDKAPSIFGVCPMVVLTDSMEPQIKGGDLVFAGSVSEPEEIKVGDVIAFFDPESASRSIVIHRVTEIVSDSDGIAFRTKGDANDDVDRSKVPDENLVGRYMGKIGGMGHIVMFMQSTTGLIVCVALPLMLLIAYDAIRRRRYDRQQSADTEALLKELQTLREQKKKDEQ